MDMVKVQALANNKHCLYWLRCRPNHAEREAATPPSSNGASTPLQNKSRPPPLLCDPSALIYWGARGGCWHWEIGCKLKVHPPVVMCTSRYIPADHATHTVPFSSLCVTCHIGWDVFPIDVHANAYMVLEEVFRTFHAFLMYRTMVLRVSLKSPKCSLFQLSQVQVTRLVSAVNSDRCFLDGSTAGWERLCFCQLGLFERSV